MLRRMVDCLVVGAGGVGGYLAALLAASGRDVAVVARGEHGAAIRRDGLRLDDPQRPEQPPVAVAVSAGLAEAPPAGVVVLGVKHADLPAVADSLPAYLAACPPDAVVVALQNGVVHLDGALAAASLGRLLAGAVYIFSEVAAPGVIRVIGGPRAYRVGPIGGEAELAGPCREVVAGWTAAGVAASAEADGRLVCWEKLTLLCPLSGLTALTGRTVGELRGVEAAMRTFRAIATEVAGTAGAEGVPVPADLPERAEIGIRLTDAGGRSSLWLDLSRGRPSELEVLLGDPLRRADRAGVPAPALRAVYAATRARWGVGMPAG